MADLKITALTENTTPVGTDLLPIVDDPSGTALTQKITLSSLGLIDGWIPASETWTYASADDPTYTFTVNADVTTKYSAGMKIKLTQTTVKYFIITAVSTFSGGNTTITIYGGTDYDLANAAISANYYSTQKSPFGFPLDPTKWEATASAAGYTKSSPSASTWYATGDSLVVPIGAWNLSYGAGLQGFKSAAQIKVALTLSSDGSTETDSDLTSWVRLDSGGVVSVPCSRQKSILQTSKTTWEFLVYTPISSMTQINLIGDDGVYNLRAVCAYL